MWAVSILVRHFNSVKCPVYGLFLDSGSGGNRVENICGIGFTLSKCVSCYTCSYRSSGTTGSYPCKS